MMLARNEVIDDRDRDIAYYAKDSRLTAEPDDKKYDWEGLIERFKQLGRKLTEEEAEQYRIR